MAKKLYEEYNIQDIADAIREKTGSTDKYSTDEMAYAIRSISASGEGGIDTSDDTVMPEVLLQGMTAHDAQGRQIVGTIPTYECDTDGVDQLFQEKTVTENGEVTPDEGYLGLSKVSVDVQATVTKTFDVTVIDYDGTVLKSAKCPDGAVFMLPEAPTREGLVFQEWSCALPITDNTVTVNGQDITIGAVYITDDGATRFHFEFESYHDKTVSIYCGGDMTIDWGDGSAVESYSGSSTAARTHTYAPASYPAKYIVSVKAVTGELTFYNGQLRNLFKSASDTAELHCTEVNFGANVTSIMNYSLHYCRGLRRVSIPSGITSILGYAFSMCNGPLDAIVVPSSVTSVGEYAFQHTKAAHIVFPQGITSISQYTFYYSGWLKSFTFSPLVASIGQYAFSYCTSLTNVFFPNESTTLGACAFLQCSSLADIRLPGKIKSLANSVFNGCTSLKSIDTPSSLTSIGQGAFGGCSLLREYNSGSSRINPSSRAFQNCFSLAVLNGVETVGHSATDTFYGCSQLKEVNLAVATMIYNGFFSNCASMRKFVIDARCTGLEYSVFYGCSALEAVIALGSLKSIQRQAFYNCTSLCLLDLRYNTVVPTLENANAFQSVPTTCKIVVPDELYDSWIAATNWITYSYMIRKASEVPEQ